MKKYNDFSDNLYDKMTKYFREQISWADPEHFKAKTLPGDSNDCQQPQLFEHKL